MLQSQFVEDLCTYLTKRLMFTNQVKILTYFTIYSSFVQRKLRENRFNLATLHNSTLQTTLTYCWPLTARFMALSLFDSADNKLLYRSLTLTHPQRWNTHFIQHRIWIICCVLYVWTWDDLVHFLQHDCVLRNAYNGEEISSTFYCFLLHGLSYLS